MNYKLIMCIALVIIAFVFFISKERVVNYNFVSLYEMANLDSNLRYWIPVTEEGFFNKADYCKSCNDENTRRIINSYNSDFVVCYGCRLIKITYRLMDRFGFTNGKTAYYYGKAYLDGDCDGRMVYVYRLHKNCIEMDTHTENETSSVWIKGNCWIE